MQVFFKYVPIIIFEHRKLFISFKKGIVSVLTADKMYILSNLHCFQRFMLNLSNFSNLLLRLSSVLQNEDVRLHWEG